MKLDAVNTGGRVGELAASPAIERLPSFWLPLLMLLSISLGIRFWNLDRLVQNRLWSAENGWTLGQSKFVEFLYDYGCIPTLVIGIGGGLLWMGSFFKPRLRVARFLSGYLALALIVGPGLIVNFVFKDHFGRPRPRQVAEFGGDRQFSDVGNPTFNRLEKSFPSGHAAMGFFWFAPGIYLWSRKRQLARALFGLAVVHGSLMGFGRMAQGAHWLSDVVWSAGMVYLSAWMLCQVVGIWCAIDPALAPICPD